MEFQHSALLKSNICLGRRLGGEPRGTDFNFTSESIVVVTICAGNGGGTEFAQKMYSPMALEHFLL